MSKFSIGIDLGTTNCAMAYVPLNEHKLAEREVSDLTMGDARFPH